MAYFLKNEEKNGLEIYFDGKPDEATRNLLKENKWRWFGEKACWYNRYSEANEQLAKRLCDDNRREIHSQSVQNRMESKKREEVDTGEEGIFGTHPECLEDRMRLRGVLLDALLGNKLLVNIILAAFDMGIASNIEKAKSLDDLFKGMHRKKLVDEFGLSVTNADRAIQFWMEEYGKKFLCMNVTCTTCATVEDVQDEPDVISAEGRKTNSPITVPNSNPVDVGALAKGEKLPKNLLRRDIKSEKSFGITEAHISAFRGYSYDDYRRINLVGEFEGKGSFGGCALVVVVVHNDKGEPIGMSSGVRFEQEALNGYYSFEMNVYIPIDELISDISLRITNDPCF